MSENVQPPADTDRTPTAVVETFDGPTDVLRVEQAPDKNTVKVHDLTKPDLTVNTTVRGRNVRRRSGYFGRGRQRWQVTYLPKT